jgi:transposase
MFSWRRGQAYSQDLRERVLAAAALSARAAARFGVSVSYVVKARQRRDRLGETAPGPQRSPGRRASWRRTMTRSLPPCAPIRTRP